MGGRPAHLHPEGRRLQGRRGGQEGETAPLGNIGHHDMNCAILHCLVMFSPMSFYRSMDHSFLCFNILLLQIEQRKLSWKAESKVGSLEKVTDLQPPLPALCEGRVA